MLWLLLLLAAWFMLTASDVASLVIGLPFVLLAILFRPKSEAGQVEHKISLSIPGLFRYLGFFIVESLRGGLDVSRRVLASEPRVSPAFFDYSMRLHAAPAQQLFISSISLLPGTLCADRDDKLLRIHALDKDMDTTPAIKQLELRVARVFGESL
jgi:multicomponent Na+:H+ antiporter subunit E